MDEHPRQWNEAIEDVLECPRTLSHFVASDKAISQPGRLGLEEQQEEQKEKPKKKEQFAQEDTEQEDFGDSGGLGHSDAGISEEA